MLRTKGGQFIGWYACAGVQHPRARFRTDRYAVPFRRYDGERLRLQRLRRLPVPRGGRHQAAALHPRTHRYGRTAGLKDELQPGDLLFFNNRGRGRVSHAGIYIGDGQFIHSASRRGGGVRVDSLDSSYWSLSYMEAKRVLEPGYKDALTSKR